MTTRRFTITPLSRRLLGPEDRKAFNGFLRLLHDDCGCPDEIDAIELLHMELVALYLVKLIAAENAGNMEVAECLDRMICLHLKALRPARRKSVSAATPSEPEKTRK